MRDETVPLSVREVGTGPRRALALHCTMAHSGAWRGVANGLKGVTLVAPDMLSHGRSSDWDEIGDFQDVTTDGVQDLFEPGMDIIGHSFGATVALRLAAAKPDWVRSLTLIEPVFFAIAVQDAPDILADHDALAGPFTEALQDRDFALAARRFNRMWSSGGPKWPDLPESLRMAMTRAVHIVPACRDAIYDDLAGVMAPGSLEQLKCPCMLLRGSESHAVIGAVNDGLARRLPDATNVVIKGAGHMLPVTHPAQTAAEIAKLFARTPP